jgi:GTP-binding protein
LIEGAHQGVGLGHQFLRHVERTKVLVHVIDMAGSEGRDPYEDYLKINEEIKLYRKYLEKRPQIVAANKMDLPDAEIQLDLFKEQVGPDVPVYPISAATGQGVKDLLYAVADLLDRVERETPAEPIIERSTERKIYRSREEKPTFTIRRENEVYVVEGEQIERLVQRTNFNYHDSVLRFAHTIRKMGVEDALRERGAKEGDTIRIGDMEFELSDGADC